MNLIVVCDVASRALQIAVLLIGVFYAKEIEFDFTPRHGVFSILAVYFGNIQWQYTYCVVGKISN